MFTRMDGVCLHAWTEYVYKHGGKTTAEDLNQNTYMCMFT
jgi:hypothetical protein